jgi:hypothetical protein
MPYALPLLQSLAFASNMTSKELHVDFSFYYAAALVMRVETCTLGKPMVSSAVLLKLIKSIVSLEAIYDAFTNFKQPI